MRAAIPAETRPGERRVAAVPETVRLLRDAGFEVAIQSGAGDAAGFLDSDYVEAGAEIAGSAAEVLAGADAVLSVQPLAADVFAQLASGCVTVSFLPVMGEGAALDSVRAARDAGATALSLELLPRISRAQSMDALTSQALCAGYRAALVGADRLPKFFPLLMTAAGTVQPARVLILGAGVAGLQAIATSKRLGAIVSAYDVRPASADEVRSMGASFVDLGLDAVEGSGGYAREMAEDRAERQRELLAPYVADSDVLITTAAVPGRAAPLLVTRAMVEAMKPGSVVVDLAAETGGNVEGSQPGEEVRIGGALVWGGRDVPSQLPVHASRLYARNVANLLLLMVKDGVLAPDLEDEIVDGCAVTHAGAIRHEPTRSAVEGEGAPA